MKQNWQRSLDLVLRHEGGYVNHPKDPGGATNKGVTQKVYDNYRRSKNEQPRSVRSITGAEVNTIYKKNYWDVVRGDEMPSGVDYLLFDGGVNSGPMQSVKWLQRALGRAYTGKVDGVIGALTIKAAKEADAGSLISKILDQRLAFLKALKTWPTFGKGWSKRLADVRSTALAMAEGVKLPAQLCAAEGCAKAHIEDAKQPPSKAAADAVSGGGTVSVILSQAAEQLTPLANNEFIGNVVAGITVLGVVLTVGGIAYRKWATTRAEELAKALGVET